MFDGSEKRKYKRIKQRFVVRIRKKIGRRKEDNTGWSVVTAENLGANGVLLNHNVKPKIGSILEMEINFPMVPDPINCVAMVNRVEEKEYSPIVSFAAVFTQIDKKAQDLIESMAEKFFFNKPDRIESYG